MILLPLLWLGTWNRHDWGDDFAQYLLQARNIAECRPQTDNGLVFPQEGDRYAVSAYPVGFPLILAPAYRFFGSQVRPYLVLLSIFLIAAGAVLFIYFQRFHSRFLALLLVMLFCYHRYILEWKWQILSDIPFLFFLVFAWTFWSRAEKKVKQTIAWGLFCAFTASIRIIGATLPIAMVITILLTDNRSIKSRIKEILVLSIISILSFIVLNSVLFDVPIISFADFYSNALQKHDAAFTANISFYQKLAGVFFTLPFTSITLPGWWLLPSLGYWLYRLSRHRELPEILFLVYGLVLLFYPYQHGGFRFLLPLLPLLLHYLIESIVLLVRKMYPRIDVRNITVPMVAILFLGNIDFVVKVAERSQESIQGPQESTSVEMLEYIRSNTSDSSIIAFNKPRALSLLTGRKTTCILRRAPVGLTRAQFDEMHVDYLLIGRAVEGQEGYAPDFLEFHSAYRTEYDTAWINRGYVLLRRSNPL